MRSRSRLLSASLLAVVAALCLPFSVKAQETRMERTITVSATGQAVAVPDMARVQSGVVAEAASAREALSANSAAMEKLIAGLKQNGVDGKDIQTASFRLEPRYTNPREGRPPVIDGYRAVNQVEVAVRDLDKLGLILDQLVTLGANQMNGLNFEVSTAETLRDEARKDAIANAKRRADLFAAAAGAKVGQVISISEGSASPPQPRFAAGRAAAMESVPVERGTETLVASVTVTWALE